MLSELEAERRYEDLLARLKQEFPAFRLLKKGDDPWQRLIHRALVLLTFGRMRTYLTSYHTTLGQSVYVTDTWQHLPATERLSTLRHEAVHLRQFRRLGFAWMAFLYLLVPLPVGLCYFRMRLEREAYEETLRAQHEFHGPRWLRDARFKERICSQFTGPSYGWMWPFPGRVSRWYDDFVEELTAGG